MPIRWPAQNASTTQTNTQIKIKKPDKHRQRTYNVTLLLWKSNKYYTLWVCVCSLRYPVCNAHAPYCHLWPVPLYIIFPHYLTKARLPEKKTAIEYKKRASIFSTNFVCNIFHSKKKNWARHDQKFVLVFMLSTRYSCQISMKLEFFRRIF